MSDVASRLDDLVFDEADLIHAAKYAAGAALVTVMLCRADAMELSTTMLANRAGVDVETVALALSRPVEVPFGAVARILFALGLDLSSMIHQASHDAPCSR